MGTCPPPGTSRIQPSSSFTCAPPHPYPLVELARPLPPPLPRPSAHILPSSSAASALPRSHLLAFSAPLPTETAGLEEPTSHCHTYSAPLPTGSAGLEEPPQLLLSHFHLFCLSGCVALTYGPRPQATLGPRRSRNRRLCPSGRRLLRVSPVRSGPPRWGLVHVPSPKRTPFPCCHLGPYASYNAAAGPSMRLP